jgi:hypothetical protein
VHQIPIFLIANLTNIVARILWPHILDLQTVAVVQQPEPIVSRYHQLGGRHYGAASSPKQDVCACLLVFRGARKNDRRKNTINFAFKMNNSTEMIK